MLSTTPVNAKVKAKSSTSEALARFVRYGLVFYCVCCSASQLHGGAIRQADFRVELGFTESFSRPRVFQSLANDLTGEPDLGSDDELANPSLYQGAIRANLTPEGRLSLIGDLEDSNGGDYARLVFQLDNIVFAKPNRLVQIDLIDDQLIDPDADNTIGQWTIEREVTDNSVRITYLADQADNGGTFNLAEGGVTEFQLRFAEPIQCGNPDLPADFDDDGRVAFTDFLILSRNFGNAVAEHALGDANCDRQVNFTDFLILSRNFGKSQPAVSVPESTGGPALLWGGLIVWRAFSNRRGRLVD